MADEQKQAEGITLSPDEAKGFGQNLSELINKLERFGQADGNSFALRSLSAKLLGHDVQAPNTSPEIPVGGQIPHTKTSVQLAQEAGVVVTPPYPVPTPAPAPVNKPAQSTAATVVAPLANTSNT